MPESQQHRAVGDGLALSEIAVCQIAADDRRDVDQSRIGPVDDARLLIREKPMLGQVENEQSPHAVVGKALPHFGKEEQIKSLRVSRKFGPFAEQDQPGRADDCDENDYRNDLNDTHGTLFCPSAQDAQRFAGGPACCIRH